MAATTEQVFIEFITDDTQLESTQDTLLRTGQIDQKASAQFKATNAELSKRDAIIKQLQKDLQSTEQQNAKNIAALESKLQTFITDFAQGFQEGIIESLKEAGLEFDEFGQVIQKTTKPVEDHADAQESLKKRLGEVRNEMLRLRVAGEDNTEQYAALRKEAGDLTDAIQGVNKQINLAANSEAKLTGTLEVLQGVAAGFTLVTAAEGLFGAENSELNEVLLKVTSAMAALESIQAIITLTKKESAAATLIQTIAEKAYNVVIGETTGLLAGLRVAFALTGIGAVVLGLTALVMWMQRSSKATKQLTQDFTRFNLEIERDLKNFDRNIKIVQQANDERQAELKETGALQSQITRESIAGMKDELRGVFELRQSMQERRDEALEILRQMGAGERDYNEVLATEAQKTVDTFESLTDRRAELAKEIRVQEIENEKQIRVEQLQSIADGVNARLALARQNSKQFFALSKESARAEAAIQLEEAGQNLAKRLLIEKELQKQLRQIDLEAARVRQEDRIAGAERELIAAQQASKAISARTSQDEIDAQKKVIQENARLALLQEGLTEQQILKIKEQSLADQLALQREFNLQSNQEALEDFISRNNVLIANIKTTNAERLELQEENLIAAAQIEIDANEGLVDKIKSIRAKLEEDLRALRLAAIEKQVSDEIEITNAKNGTLRRANERIVADENKSLSKRIAAINQLAGFEIQNINTRDDANKKLLKDKIISQEEYNRRSAILIDEEKKVYEDAEIAKRKLSFETHRGNVVLALETANQIASIVQQFGQQETEREQQRIDEQRARIDELREAGAISEKRALERQKRLDIEEAKLKRKQAERDKGVALFQAVINTAAAIAKALPNLVLAGIAAALGAAQIALIASRPIPKFGKGKKNQYEGPAEIGETGAELVQSRGNMYLAKKRSFVWLGRQDKVFNPSETAAMLEKGGFEPYIIKDAGSKEYRSVYNNQIDYDKFGKAVADNMPQVGLNIDEKGITTYMNKQGLFEKYLDNRRSY